MKKHARAESRIHLPLVLTAGVFAAAVAFGGSAVGHPAIATAEPNTDSWDLEAWEACMRKIDTTQHPGAQFLYDDYIHNEMMKCCVNTGGVWHSDTNTCVAPPAQGPANRRIPPDLGNAPAVTMTPQGPPPPVGATG
jgi:hypothetical protein